MKTTLTIIAGISSLMSLLFSRIEHSQLGIIFIGIAVFLSVCALIVHLKKNRQTAPLENPPKKILERKAELS